MAVNVFVDNNILHASVEGKLNSVTSSDFENSVREKLTDDINEIVLDFEKVDFITSKALRVLVSLYKDMPNGNITLVNPNNMVLEVLKLTGLTDVFKVESK